MTTIVPTFFIGALLLVAAAEDRCNYDATVWEERNFGPEDWGEVQCDNLGDCVS